MPKYTRDYIAGYVLYFTSKCIVEAMHVHAGDKTLTPSTSAKLYVYEDGSTKVENWGTVNKEDMLLIQKYIKLNHKEMYSHWKMYSDNGYYKKL